MMSTHWSDFASHRRFFFRYTWPLKLAAFRAGRRLKRTLGKKSGKSLKSVVAVVPYYGDEQLLPWFLTYYRKIGISYFVFLDISAGHDLTRRLDATVDCAVWVPNGFTHPGSTIHALNYLRHRYARTKWCLSVEPCDFMVFPKSETRHIRDLIDFLESEQRRHAYAIVVDTYGDVPSAEMTASSDTSPFEQLPYFDRFGYQTGEIEELRVVPLVGGVQRRSLYGDEPHKAPALNRIPLIKLAWDCYYSASTRVLVPPRFNTAHSEWHSTTTACLMRYALLSDEMSLHIAKQAESGQLYQDNVTTMFPGSEALARMTLKTQATGKFNSTQDLLDCGLLNNGQWF